MTDSAQDRARALAPIFAAMAPEWDRTRRYPWPNVDDMAAVGLMGMTIPREYGGQGASWIDVVLAVEEVARECALSARILVESNMGAISAVMAYGTDEQKAFCADIVLAGDKPAICITEPEAGSDATAMQTTARRTDSGYILNGTKHWITGGGVSKLYLVFARVIGKGGRDEGIGGFILHRDPAAGIDPAGFGVIRRERTMGLCGMPEAELRFTDVEIPAARALIPPRGFADLMTAYNSQRVGAGTIALGIAAGALDRATQYLKQREQFGRPLAEFQGLQWMLADMDTQVHAARLMLHEAARSDENGFPDRNLAARAKLFASEMAVKVVNDALQMFGARGYSDAEPLERMARDVRMFTIGGGTAQVLRTQVAGHRLAIRIPQTREGYTPPAQVIAAE